MVQIRTSMLELLNGCACARLIYIKRSVHKLGYIDNQRSTATAGQFANTNTDGEMEKNADTLVVFYSPTGFTRRVAEEIARQHRFDIEEIGDRKSRTEPFGALRSVVEALARIPARHLPTKRAAKAYELVIVGTPIWAAHVSSPIRAYLREQGCAMGNVAFFCTYGGAGAATVMKEMKSLCHAEPRSTLDARDEEINGGQYRRRVAEFLDKCGLSYESIPLLVRQERAVWR